MEDLILWGDAMLIFQQRRRNKKTKGTCLALPFITNWRIKRQKRIDVGDLGVIWAWQNIFHTENKNHMRWEVKVIGWLNLCFFFCLQRARKNLYTFLLIFFFFFVYSVHISLFFFPYCKNLCTFCAFFCLPCAHQ